MAQLDPRSYLFTRRGHRTVHLLGLDDPVACDPLSRSSDGGAHCKVRVVEDLQGGDPSVAFEDDEPAAVLQYEKPVGWAHAIGRNVLHQRNQLAALFSDKCLDRFVLRVDRRVPRVERVKEQAADLELLESMGRSITRMAVGRMIRSGTGRHSRRRRRSGRLTSRPRSVRAGIRSRGRAHNPVERQTNPDRRRVSRGRNGGARVAGAGRKTILDGVAEHSSPRQADR